MSDVVISVENLSKRYLVGHNTPQTELHTDFREAISRNVSNLARKTRDMLSGRPLVQGDEVEEFWALNDVSFKVRQGERLGIIGRNGAGKSTLLKVLSRITEPTKGRVRITGRVASLLEVGTGFHPELSGRENIYLNGAMLGMSRAEVRRKFDEIVAFADVERFLDTPVKRYSSGMYVRLAFAVAAHLEPEILIADEVLAVGDASFQNKCLEKMSEVARLGRTVLFVSHNLAAVRQLCDRTLLLGAGRVEMDGQTNDVVTLYVAKSTSQTDTSSAHINFSKDAFHLPAYFSQVSLHKVNGETQRHFSIGDDLLVRFKLSVSKELQGRPVKLALQLRTADGIQLSNMTDTDSHFQLAEANADNAIAIELRDIRFYPNKYFLSLWSGSVDSRTTYDFAQDCISFEIVDGGTKTSRLLPRDAGLIYLTPDWQACTAS